MMSKRAAVLVVGLVALLSMVGSVVGTADADVIPGVETHGNGNTYVLLDSTDQSGPTFNSPVYAPTNVTSPLLDDDFDQVNLGFAFEFYGIAHASVFIGANGFLTFVSGSKENINGDLATETMIDSPGVFVLHDDLFPGQFSAPNSEVRYGTFGPLGSRVFVVEYHDVYRFGGETSGATFQVRLFETTNTIEFHYFDVIWGVAAADFGAGATVGIRAGGEGTAFLQYVSNSPQIDNGLAIRLWQPSCAGFPATIVGDRGDDVLPGGAAADVIYGHHGNDTITGSGGADRLCGGNGNDSIDGGADDDVLFGDDGADTIMGGDGDDTAVGGAGNDVMFGGPGNDIMRGNEGADQISGEDGADRLLGGIDSDLLDGGEGNDYLGGFGGDDTIIGGAGNDTIFGGFGRDDIVGGPGNDTIRGLIGDDTIRGGLGNDVLDGDRGNDLIIGGPDNDTIGGGNANDVLEGNEGDDTLSGGKGDDSLSGGVGTDTCTGNLHTNGDTADATCEKIFGVP